MIPQIPIPFTPKPEPGSVPVLPLEPPAGVFTVRDAVAWLGVDWLDWMEAENLLVGRHGGPLVAALLDARDAQGTDITPAQVLAKHGIDPANPTAAARRYDRQRSGYDDASEED